MNLNEKIEEVFKNLAQSIDLQSRDSVVLIIDGINNFIRTLSMMSKYDVNGNDLGGVYGFLYGMGYMIKLFNPTRIIIVFDGQNGSQRRKEIYPEYKFGRSNKFPVLKKNYIINEENIEENKEAVKYQFNKLIEYLSFLPVTIIAIDNIEADDTISVIVRELEKNKENKQNIIASTDKDYYQLISEKTFVWNPVKKVKYDNQKILEEYHCLKENFVFRKILLGDKSDNIPKIGNIGEKKFLEQFSILKEKPLTLEEFLEVLKNNKKIEYDEQKIRDFYKIINLSEDFISYNNKLKIIQILKEQEPPDLDIVGFEKLLKKDGVTGFKNNWMIWFREHFLTLQKFKKIKS